MSEYFESITDIFGLNVFNDSAMRKWLPKDIYNSLQKTMAGNQPLDSALGDAVAKAIKDWAISKGATHYCHWFQPLTGLTAEKHDSFISPTSDGKVIMEFSGKELCQGEPDASSFPSGGLRATFEARGYTAWDCTSPVFVKQNGNSISLYIPSAFCSYTGFALDKKTPLLRSMAALNTQMLRILKLLGSKKSRGVIATLGAEQEYFLIDRSLFEQRLDLMLTGRTLFGAPSPRGQEMDDHYFGSIHERVSSYMEEVNAELWRLGVSAKTQHNEVAPAQYEMAPVFTTVNVATDHNQLVMEVLQKVAAHHGFVCLLHEKPFAGVNGSGKHNNWSIVTDTGINLLNPGKTPHDNMVFMVTLCAVVKAVDKYANLLRATVAVAGNEHRLGADEAPPAIVSIFLGDQLTDIFDQLLASGGAKTSKQGERLQLGVSTLPQFPKDCTDRNRTSPFAFTGNRFEFRMVGSTQSTAGPTFVFNTIVADSLCDIADELEKSSDIVGDVQKILCKIVTEHGRIVFNGDNYTQSWADEAKKRNLPNIKSTVEALETITSKENIALFEKHCILSETELYARKEVLIDSYSMTINIEAKTALDIAQKQILPAVLLYSEHLANATNAVTTAGIDSKTHKAKLTKLCKLIDSLDVAIDSLSKAVETASVEKDLILRARLYRDEVVTAMDQVRSITDSLELIVDAELWPLPSYAQMLFLK